MEINKITGLETKVKRAWNKPKLYSGKGIGFLGLGHVQGYSSTGPGGSPS